MLAAERAFGRSGVVSLAMCATLAAGGLTLTRRASSADRRLVEDVSWPVAPAPVVAPAPLAATLAPCEGFAQEPEPDDAASGYDGCGFDPGIHRLDDTHFTVTRDLQARVLASPHAAGKGARVVFSIKDGAPEGIKLFAIRPSSVYSRLGLMNGDTLRAIDGHPLATPDQALAAYAAVRDACSFTLSLVRRGRPLELHYPDPLTMDLYFKRYFWLLGVVVVVACASFAAAGVNSVLEAKLLSERPTARKRHVAAPAGADGETPPAAPAEPAHKSKDGAPLADRNMFCSACKPAPVVAATDAGPVDPNNPPTTSLPLRLLATNVSTVDGDSFATILNTTNDKGGAYWTGHRIPAAGKVVKIRGKYVDLENESSRRVERLALGGADVAPAVASAPPPPSEEPSAEPKNEWEAAFENGIKKVDSNFDIDRGLVDKVLANPLAVAKGARVVPSIKNGKPNGFKLYAIRPSSVYAKLGLMNGDTINSVNGFDLTTPDKALEVYTKVRESNNISITVTRRGKTVTQNYSIK